MSCLQSRKTAFCIVTLIYLAATALGVVVYIALDQAFWLKLLVADVAATAFTFAFSVILKNASVYDPYWSVQPIVIVLGFAIGYGVDLAGAFLLAAICFWGVRLTANWAYIFHGLHCQDWRYTMLKEKTGKFYPVINFVGIHLVPTLVVYGCVLPAAYVLYAGGAFNAGVAVFTALSVGAAVMQGVADIQMQKFRKAKTGGFIRIGLWKYSRHPNYLGEILMWWGIGLASVCALGGAWWLLVGAVANTLLFLAVSIPMAEKRNARRGDFAAYKSETRMLLPVYKRAPKK